MLSQLISPLDGVVLKLHARAGERPGAEGVMDVGANQAMQASIEVYESDISLIRLDQSVRLISENGGFRGELVGRVLRISPQVDNGLFSPPIPPAMPTPALWWLMWCSTLKMPPGSAVWLV